MTKRPHLRTAKLCTAVLLGAISFQLTSCGRTSAGAAEPTPPEVEVVTVEQRDIPIYREWIGTLAGMVDAAIRSQVTGYLLTQDYSEGSTVRLAEAQRDSAVVQYQKTIQTAFTEVSNALIAHQRVQEARVKQEALVAVLEERKRLAYIRYQGGVDTQLNDLDADRDLPQAQAGSPTDQVERVAQRRSTV